MSNKKSNYNEHKLAKSVLTEGLWEDGTPWQFIISHEELNSSLCTAVFCVITSNNKLLIVKHKSRGWELPGGRIDEGEKIREALEREILEKSGAVIKVPKAFGYKKISPIQPLPYKNTGRFYPFPLSYVPYYFAEATEIFDIPLTRTISAIKIVGLKEAEKLLAVGHNHDRIINHLVEAKKIKLQK